MEKKKDLLYYLCPLCLKLYYGFVSKSEEKSRASSMYLYSFG